MFEMDTRLQQDCLVLGDFPLCRLLLSKDANYPWFILVPRRAGVSEVFDLSQEDQAQLFKETTDLSQALKGEFKADKMNVATLGNVVSQLHMHVIVRRHGDVAWPAPVWGKVPAGEYAPGQVDAIRQRLRTLLDNDYREA
ncbi:HIT domain-containing protein [Pseudomonas sp. SWRI59]|uniref:HIT family protein n=1 Tax=Pseudomonas TaxID=286 RepID=UPI001646F2E1|nr:HIT domain-containing protein [Pseudomonas sp. B21-047]MBC3504105.1 HIT domain-containing protein [Pseudomonas sp. SWRI59]MBC3509484.1 HIT domain-containing protein [Pseudomonas sp. SWRI68]UVL02790.1 HIT domain-containing protein [Pseudomonas sp. B21-047]